MKRKTKNTNNLVFLGIILLVIVLGGCFYYKQNIKSKEGMENLDEIKTKVIELKNKATELESKINELPKEKKEDVIIDTDDS